MSHGKPSDVHVRHSLTYVYFDKPRLGDAFQFDSKFSTNRL